MHDLWCFAVGFFWLLFLNFNYFQQTNFTIENLVKFNLFVHNRIYFFWLIHWKISKYSKKCESHNLNVHDIGFEWCFESLSKLWLILYANHYQNILGEHVVWKHKKTTFFLPQFSLFSFLLMCLNAVCFRFSCT